MEVGLGSSSRFVEQEIDVRSPLVTDGASREAVRFHYDIGNEFYALWLDRSMTYSAALWGDAVELDEAQRNKLEFHIDWVGARSASRVLDVGCGWGSLAQRLVQEGQTKGVTALTLSEQQARYVRHLELPGVEVRVESWEEHKPTHNYDAVFCIGAMEHFVSPLMSSEDRVRKYRRFFASCAEWLKPGGCLSLQTSAYGNGSFVSGAIASIFPESDLPRLEQLISAADHRLEIVEVRNDRHDYVLTCRSWLDRLTRRREEAIVQIGEETTRHYEAFLSAAARGFESGVFSLLRMKFQRRTK